MPNDASNLRQAVVRAEELSRVEGVAMVTLYLGAAPYSGCKITGWSARVLGDGNSNDSLLDAVAEAERQMRVEHLSEEPDLVLEIVRAIRPNQTHGFFFDTAQFVEEVARANRQWPPLTTENANALLDAHASILPVEGDNFLWYLLPDGVRRRGKGGGDGA